MALFGFSRQPGKNRNYFNAQTGQSLSRRQYDKLVTANEQRKRLPESRTTKTGRLQNQYNALLESYVRSQSARGKPISKKAARESAEFKAAVKMIRIKRPLNETKIHREARQTARQMGLNVVGGDDFFRQVYENQISAALNNELADNA